MTRQARGRPFRQGQSGNPKGRPPTGQSIAEHIRQLGGEDGHVYVGTLHKLATGRHRDTRARLAAIGLLLDRGYGKPPQGLAISADIHVDMGDVSVMSDQELCDELDRLKKQLAPR